jgi:hypothetical protein
MGAVVRLAKRLCRFSGVCLLVPSFLAVGYLAAWLARRGNRPDNPRLVWGSTPILNYSHWSQAMKQAGYTSETFVEEFYTNINRREDWDRLLSEQYKWAPRRLKLLLGFLHSLFRYDVFIISFNGFFIGRTPLAYFQAQILKVAGKKTIVLPFGSDSYVYRRVRSTGTLQGLMMSYPLLARKQRKIARDVDYWCEHADAVIPAFMGPDGFGRWDVLIPNSLSLDVGTWKASEKGYRPDGWSGTVVIVHAPNHRGFKGTEFVVEAVRILKAEGLKVELRLLEKIQNTEVRRILREEADILVDQIVASGHGLNAVEGMASGLPVVCNLEDEAYLMPVRRWAYFGECPLVSGSPETIVEVLRKLATRPELRERLGKAGRAYAEKYHGLDSGQYLFTNVIDLAYGRKENLNNLYHPLLGEYTQRSSKVCHPLVNNRIVD